MTFTNSRWVRLHDPRPTPSVRATLRPKFSVSSLHGEWFAIAVMLTLGATSGSLAQQADRPDFSTVSQAVQQYFASVEDYQPGDLITQSQVKGALENVFKVGWEIPDSAAIVELALPDDSFLIKELSSSRGKKFMRKLTKSPGTFSRLDRLSTIARGRELVRQLVNDKGGDVLIEYMATTKGGENLGRMMAGAQRGVDLNKPTGRIYTTAELLNVLNLAYKETNP